MSMPRGALWIFGYGSLMWRPDFLSVESARARLDGWNRCFCISSTHHRGSAARPGLVLGLDRGGLCEGIAYRVGEADAANVLSYLRLREQINGVYCEKWVSVTLGSEPRHSVTALAFVVERCHPSYAGRLPLAEQAHLIRGARGISGVNLDYLFNTVRHLQDLGIRERSLERLAALAGPHIQHMANGAHASPSAHAICRVVARLPDAARRMRRDQRRRFLYRGRMGQ